jgi:hypothetical protein
MVDGENRGGSGQPVNASLPVVVLTMLGAVIAVLGLFAAGDIVLVIVGLAAVAVAGVLYVMGSRR